MRAFPFLAAAAVLAVATPAAAATRNFGITSFDKVRIEGPFKVTVTTGVAPFARARGSPAALDRVAIQVRGNTLVVGGAIGSWGGYPGADPGPVDISLGTHDLRSAWLNGSGALAIDRVSGLSFDLSVQGSGSATIDSVGVDQFSANIAGTASARLRGEAARMTAILRGIAGLDASSLAVRDLVLGSEGAATVTANVTNSAKIDASGAATIALAGRPACTLHTRGSTSVSGCR